MFHFGAAPQIFNLFRGFGEDESHLWHVSGAPSMRNVWPKRSPGLPMLINGTGIYEYGALHFSYGIETYTVTYGALHFSYILGGIVEASLSESAAGTSTVSAAGTLYQALVAAGSAAVVGAFSTGKNVDAALDGSVVVDESTVANQTLHALISSSLEAMMFVRVQGQETPVWMVNTDLWAATRFTNYDFDSYAKIGDSYYAASEDGLFELDGDDDDGTGIDASAMLKQDRAGSSQQKRVDRVYVHGTSDGKVEVRVITPAGDLYAYRSEVSLGDEVSVQRVKIGRGLVAQYWRFEVRNVDGGALDVDEIEVVSLHATRKIRR